MLRDQKENFTFFAPNDSGFGKFDINTIQNDKDKTFEMLSMHKIVGHGAYTMDRIGNHSGKMITINNHEGGFVIIKKHDDGSITAFERDGFRRERTIVEADITASNGVLHIIDGIL